MRLEQIFNIQCLVENMTSRTKEDALSEMIEGLMKSGLKIDPARTLDILLQREKLGSTGIGDGVAIPHGKIQGIEDIVVVFGRSKKGIEFDSVDKKPVSLFFLLLAPENSAGDHLKTLAKISKMLKTASIREKLIIAKTAGDLYQTIIDQDESCSL